jgi:hypothetical protein
VLGGVSSGAGRERAPTRLQPSGGPQPGFQWGDAGIGAAGAVVLLRALVRGQVDEALLERDQSLARLAAMLADVRTSSEGRPTGAPRWRG